MLKCLQIFTIAVYAWGGISMTMIKAQAAYSGLYDRAVEGLTANIVDIDGRHYLRAGKSQFSSLWTRDFAYSIPGLLTTGHSKVVRDHLQLLLSQMRPSDGLLPRVVDSANPKYRVLVHLLVGGDQLWPLRQPLKPEYKGEHGTMAIDSNILVLRGAIMYLNTTGDKSWWESNKAAFAKVYTFYQNKFFEGLIQQQAYSDWQDSVRRAGATFLTNFLYWSVSIQLQEQALLPVDQGQIDELHSILLTKFRNPNGLFRSHLDLDVVSLDGNLFALEDKSFLEDPEERELLYDQLKSSLLFTKFGIPGIASQPNYPRSWRSYTATIVGLGNYHGEMFWSWLMAFAAKVANDYRDTKMVEKILTMLENLSERDASIAEIYCTDGEMKPFSSYIYHSESPFSWGSAYTAWALHQIDL